VSVLVPVELASLGGRLHHLTVVTESATVMLRQRYEEGGARCPFQTGLPGDPWPPACSVIMGPYPARALRMGERASEAIGTCGPDRRHP
jgi:hypothetical protein